MKEIGGYFGFEKLDGKEYHEKAVKLNCARNALLYSVFARGIKKVYLPFFLCDSVADALCRNGIRTEFYRVGKDFKPIFDGAVGKDELFYIVNYYGQLSQGDIKEYIGKYGRVAVDNVQAFFDKPVKGADTIYSCRKYFGVPDGAYLYTDFTFDGVTEKESAINSTAHLVGRFEESASEHYAEFKNNDKKYRGSAVKYMSDFSENILRAVDYKTVAKKREENFAVLEKGLKNLNGVKIKMPKGPYCFPFYFKGGMELKKKLAEKKIYVPTLWGNATETEDETARDYSANILPLPCDQRYSAEDMEFIVRELLCLIK